LRSAVRELSYLFTHEYSQVAALKLVGDHHQLTARQRQAVLRSACSDLSLRERTERRIRPEQLEGAYVGVDGFNCLITIESMLSRAPVFIGRDSALRDLASVHGTYRSVEETESAARALGSALGKAGVRGAHVFLDRPVGNSGRLRAFLLELFKEGPLEVSVSLHDQVDQELIDACEIVASADAFILDHADAWLDLPGLVIATEGYTPWLVDLRES
jgi:hypothetical protein